MIITTNLQLKKIIFSYGFKRGLITNNFSKSEINLINFKDMKLPISTDPNDFGTVMEELRLESYKLYIIHDKLGRTITFKEFEKENIIAYSKNGLEILKFKDLKFEDNKFLRKLGSKSLFFENGSKSLELLTIINPFISKLKKR